MKIKYLLDENLSRRDRASGNQEKISKVDLLNFSVFFDSSLLLKNYLLLPHNHVSKGE